MRLQAEYFTTSDGERRTLGEAMHCASLWHGGQFTELYKLSSSGDVDDADDLLAEVKACAPGPSEGLADIELDVLLGYALALVKETSK